jgi:CMP-N-acetylneuraminic acid synthetase
MKILAIIPARGGSKGIPRKNIIDINGKPLIAYTIEATKKAKLIDKNIVSTDDKEIAQVSKNYGANIPFLRPEKASTDSAQAIDVIKHALDWFNKNENYSPDAVLYLQPTSPLRTNKHIDEAIKKFVSNPEADSLVSVVKPSHNFHPIKIMKQVGNYLEPYLQNEGLKKLDRHNMPTLYGRNGPAILISKVNILNNNDLYGRKILPFEMDEISSHDIDEPFDLELAEFFIKKSSDLK